VHLEASHILSALQECLPPASLAPRLALAQRAGLFPEGGIGSPSFELLKDAPPAPEDEEEAEEEAPAHCCFPRELLLLLGFLHMPDAAAKAAARLLSQLAETDEPVDCPVLLASGEADQESLDDAQELLWQLLANEALSGGFLRLASDAEDDSDASFAFLLRAPGVRDSLAAALRLREAAYGAERSVEAEVELAAAMRGAGRAKEAHAAQLRASERGALRAAREQLGRYCTARGEVGGRKRGAGEAGGEPEAKRVDAGASAKQQDPWSVFE
jgi:hypothetical protein